MRVLITGSEGVLGSNLKRELRRRGHDVYGCDLLHSSDENVQRADVAERRQLTRVFDLSQPEVVYHFAAEFGRMNGQEYYEQLWKTNCIGTRNVIEECVRTKAKLVFASSSEAYGMADDYAPDGEDFQESWLDKYAPQFHNEYALSKYTNERQITMAARNDNLDACILRFFNAYGPGEPYNPYRSVVCLFTYRLLKGLPITVYKDYYRTHMFINDWCNTVANIANPKIKDLMSFNKHWVGAGATPYVPVFNIGGTEYESVEALKDKIVNLIGGSSSEITYLDAEKANVVSKKPDNHLAELWLEHNPVTTLDQGLPLTIEWMKKEYSL
jgi:dTDP-glucose 4,6-dehydratase